MCLVSLVVVAVTTCWKARSSEEVDTLLLDNIEALAAGEEGSTAMCVGNGSVYCPITHLTVMRVYEPFRSGF